MENQVILSQNLFKNQNLIRLSHSKINILVFKIGILGTQAWKLNQGKLQSQLNAHNLSYIHNFSSKNPT